MLDAVRTADPEIYAALTAETRRQVEGLELIASENFTSQAVLETVGTPLTNKYAEGLPGKRYYGGCQHVDTAERIAIERATQLFGAEAANVQPHSGAQANMAVYFAVLEPKDHYVAMSLAEGGHLTHGSPVNFSGRLYKVLDYGVHPETHRLDYDRVHRLLQEHKPKLLVAGASAYPRTIDFERLGTMARDAGAKFLVDMAHIAGLVAAGEHPSPVPHADFVTTTTPQDAARPSRRADPHEVRAREEGERPRISRHAGRAADARHRREGGRVQGSHVAGVQGLPGPGGEKREGDGRGILVERLSPDFRGDGQPPFAPRREGLAQDDGKNRGGDPRQGRHHREQEHDPR